MNKAQVQFTLTNPMTTESATRDPSAEGYASGKQSGGMASMFGMFKSFFPNGQQPTQITVTWSTWINMDDPLS
ncbi:hypothetical protein [Streptomyces pseudoechinosporeus]